MNTITQTTIATITRARLKSPIVHELSIRIRNQYEIESKRSKKNKKQKRQSGVLPLSLSKIRNGASRIWLVSGEKWGNGKIGLDSEIPMTLFVEKKASQGMGGRNYEFVLWGKDVFRIQQS